MRDLGGHTAWFYCHCRVRDCFTPTKPLLNMHQVGHILMHASIKVKSYTVVGKKVHLHQDHLPFYIFLSKRGCFNWVLHFAECWKKMRIVLILTIQLLRYRGSEQSPIGVRKETNWFCIMSSGGAFIVFHISVRKNENRAIFPRNSLQTNQLSLCGRFTNAPLIGKYW